MSRPPLPTVTVVVPALDAQVSIEACVLSLLELDYPSELVELVVVDNGSRDATRALLARYSGRVTVLEEVRPGRSAARNAGVRHSTREVVAFTDADCTVAPAWLRELVRPLSDAAVGITGGRILAREGATAAELFGETIHDQRAAIRVWRPPYVSTASWASRRAVLEEVGLFDEQLAACEDGDLSYRIGQAGYDLVYVPDAVVRHGNRRSLLALYREGLRHGFYAVPVKVRYADYIAAAQSNPAPESDWVPSAPLDSRYGRAFRAGKRAGAAAGRALATVRRSRLPRGSPS